MPFFPPGGTPNSLLQNQLFVAPNGSDNNPGDSWSRPMQYIKSAWNKLVTLGGGILYFADQSHISADGKGLHVSGPIGGVYPTGSVPAIPISVIGVSTASFNTALFQNVPPAIMLGGSTTTDQDDPGLWISTSNGYPMSFENIQTTTELNKIVRIGWDYPRDDNGDIITAAVTDASRAAGSTVFTCTPSTYDICAVSRTSNVVTVILRNRDGMPSPIRTGASVFVDYTNGVLFTPVVATVTNVAQSGNKFGFQIASTGSDFSDGSTSGPSIGTAASNCGAPNDWVTIYGGVTEFPASVYLITAVSDTTITVRDVYGYSPRSATASSSNIGTYAVQDRQNFLAGKINLNNITGRLINDASPERFVNGPGLDCGGLEFFTMSNMGVFGNNVAEASGEYGCRDPDRRAAMLFNTGNAAAGIGFGQINVAPIGYGGIRFWCSVNASSIVTMKHVCVDQPIVGFKSIPAVEVLNGNQTHVVYLEDISVVDTSSNVPAVICSGPPSCVRVNSVFGDISGPCTKIAGQLPSSFADDTSTPNAQFQTGYYGADRLIAGRHPGTYRNGNIASNPLSNLGVSNNPDDWTVDGGITVTKNVRDPFNGNSANHFVASGNGQVIQPYAGGYATVANVGDIIVGCVWMRGVVQGQAFSLDVRYNPDNTLFFQQFGSFPLVGDGEWNCIAVGGRLTQNPNANLPSGNISATFQISMSSGDAIDLYEPTILVFTSADDASFAKVSDNELAEIITNLKTTPKYLASGMVGTHQDQKLIAHGGYGTNSANKKTVGVSSGQLTLTGTGTVYLPTYDADGTTIIGWVAQLQATVNP